MLVMAIWVNTCTYCVMGMHDLLSYQASQYEHVAQQYCKHVN